MVSTPDPPLELKVEIEVVKIEPQVDKMRDLEEFSLPYKYYFQSQDRLGRTVTWVEEGTATVTEREFVLLAVVEGVCGETVRLEDRNDGPTRTRANTHLDPSDFDRLEAIAMLAVAPSTSRNANSSDCPARPGMRLTLSYFQEMAGKITLTDRIVYSPDRPSTPPRSPPDISYEDVFMNGFATQCRVEP